MTSLTCAARGRGSVGSCRVGPGRVGRSGRQIDQILFFCFVGWAVWWARGGWAENKVHRDLIISYHVATHAPPWFHFWCLACLASFVYLFSWQPLLARDHHYVSRPTSEQT